MLPLRTGGPASSKHSSLCCDVLETLLQFRATSLCVFGLPVQSARLSGRRLFIVEMQCLIFGRSSYMRAYKYKLQLWVRTRSTVAPSREGSRAGLP